jgi:hypothetical protein
MKDFIRKQPAASDDYLTARKLVLSMKQGQHQIISVDNLKAFRKYVHDLGGKTQKSFTTRKLTDTSIKVICIS